MGVERSSSKKRKNNASDLAPTKVKRKEVIFSTTIEMPTLLRDRINEMRGYDIEIVIQKQLQDTDVSKHQGRLLIPMKKVSHYFATNRENEFLSHQEEGDKNKNGLKVLIIDPVLRESVIGLKLWKNGSRSSYCLTSNWNSLVRQNLLESGDYIQLWRFRKNDFDAGAVTSNLCFALVKLDISEGIFKFL